MIPTAKLVTDYFSPPKDGIWRWSPDGVTLVTREGKTIGFQQEVIEILTPLVPQGFPPFGAIVMLIAACRDGWIHNEDLRRDITGFSFATRILTTDPPPQVSTGRFVGLTNAIIQQRVEEVFRHLDRLASLTPDLRKTADAKAFIASCVFETTKPITTPREAETLLRELRNGVPREHLTQTFADALEAFLIDVDALRGLKDLTQEKLELRRKTGLDQLVLSAGDVELPPPQRVRNLIDALRNDPDPELSGLARLAQNLMAAVHVPRNLTPDDDMPLGGFTDIANRGPLDRLLASELAHDDLTLAVRVALNEALYLRRESPPRSPPDQRAMLIDMGIRMWGLPRVFATAAALALTATANEKVEIRSFRSTETGIQAEDITARDGLITHLAALETSPHPAAAMKPFFDELKSTGAGAETIFITHPDTLSDPDFKAALAAIPNLDFYVATVDRSGAFRFFHYSSSGQMLLREATFSLDGMLARNPAAESVTVKDKEINTDLPLILSSQRFPLLVPHAVNFQLAKFNAKHGAITVTNDGRLMLWSSDQYGPHQLSQTVPPGKVVKVLVYNDAEVLIVIDPVNTSKLILFRCVISSLNTSVTNLPPRANSPCDILLQDDKLILIYAREIDAVSLSTGIRLEKFHVADAFQWIHGAYFKNRNDWFRLFISGGNIRFMGLHDISMPTHASPPPSNTIAIIDRMSAEGRWALTSDGLLKRLIPEPLIFTADGSLKRTSPGPVAGPVIRFPSGIASFHGASDDGNLLTVTGTDSRFYLLNVLAQNGHAVSKFDDHFNSLLVPQIVERVKAAPKLPFHPARVSIASNGNIYFTTAGTTNLFLEITLNRDSHLWLLSHNVESDFNRRTGAVNFIPVPGPAGVRYTIGVARFLDGSRIFFDSRGLLHLKSSDLSMPEIALILNPQRVTAWSSDGKCCGRSYFLDPHRKDVTLVEDEIFYKMILKFTERLR